MWCIGRISAEYRQRMYDLLELYTKPYDAAEPVICLDEKSKQLLEQTRRPTKSGSLRSSFNVQFKLLAGKCYSRNSESDLEGGAITRKRKGGLRQKKSGPSGQPLNVVRSSRIAIDY